MEWEIVVHPLAAKELNEIPERERAAVRNAMIKLRALGPQLGFPNSSAVLGADRLRELRPRTGNCPWRAFYRQVGSTFIVAAIGPEAQVKPRSFEKAIQAAEQRLAGLEGKS